MVVVNSGHTRKLLLLERERAWNKGTIVDYRRGTGHERKVVAIRENLGLGWPFSFDGLTELWRTFFHRDESTWTLSYPSAFLIFMSILIDLTDLARYLLITLLVSSMK